MKQPHRLFSAARDLGCKLPTGPSPTKSPTPERGRQRRRIARSVQSSERSVNDTDDASTSSDQDRFVGGPLYRGGAGGCRSCGLHPLVGGKLLRDLVLNAGEPVRYRLLRAGPFRCLASFTSLLRCAPSANDFDARRVFARSTRAADSGPGVLRCCREGARQGLEMVPAGEAATPCTLRHTEGCTQVTRASSSHPTPPVEPAHACPMRHRGRPTGVAGALRIPSSDEHFAPRDAFAGRPVAPFRRQTRAPSP